jgi:hypothetical protein
VPVLLAHHRLKIFVCAALLWGTSTAVRIQAADEQVKQGATTSQVQLEHVGAQVANIESMSLIDVSSYQSGESVYVLGNNMPGDGGDGRFIYSRDSQALDDGGVIIQPKVGKGRWSRIYDQGSIKPEWWGAQNNVSVDSTVPICKALSLANRLQGGRVVLSGGRYKITDTIRVIGNYSKTRYPENSVVGVGLSGAGQNATRLEWWGKADLQTVRKAMIVMEGFTFIENLELISPRYFETMDSSLEQTKTCYYGIVLQGTAWKMSIINVNVRFFHVCLSGGIIKKWTDRNGNGIEFEPKSGGQQLDADVAQWDFRNCCFVARTQEFFDGSLNKIIQKNASGSLLSRGSGASLDLSLAPVSDGSYAVELGTPQAVNVTFTGCSIVQDNVEVNGTIRVHNAGNVIFESCLITAPPAVLDNSFGLFENIQSGGSTVHFDHCYHIGGIFHGNGSQGLVTITNGDGENGPREAYEGAVVLFSPLPHVSCFGQSLRIDGLNIGRGSQKKIIVLSRLQQTTSVGCPFGTTSVFTGTAEHYRMKDLNGISMLEIGHETLTSLVRFEPSTSLLPNIALLLKGRQLNPLLLEKTIYNQPPHSDASGFSNNRALSGIPMLLASHGAKNVFEAMVPIEDSICYNFSADIFVSIEQPEGSRSAPWLARLELEYFNAKQEQLAKGPVMLSSSDPTINLQVLVNGSITRLRQFHLVPPVGSSYAAVRFEAREPNDGTVDIAIGNIRLWPAPSEEVSDWIPNPEFAASAPPSSGVWREGDFVRNNGPEATELFGWSCISGGEPGRWVAFARIRR